MPHNPTPPDDLATELKKTNRLLRNFISKKQAFYRGIIGGLGASLGATIVFAIVWWILSQLQFIPFIAPIAKPAGEYIRHNVPTQLR